PAIRAARDGTFYGSSENGLGAGTVAWKSTDGGRHFSSLLSPNNVSATQDTGFAPGGGDTDLAVAPIRNASGQYNVYVSSLTLADVDVSTSTDGGATWALNPVAASVPGDDREWIAADDASKVCVSYHDLAFNLWVNCSYDAGASFTQLADAFDAAHAWLIDSNSTGNLAIDPASHTIYQTFSGPADASGTVAGGGCAFRNTANHAVSRDGGRTRPARCVRCATSDYDGVNPPDHYPDSAAWYVYFAQNLDAASPKGTFSQGAATPIIHYGGVCLSGIACTGNRDLYDDFGVAANPLTGLASIVYSDDQYRNDANNAPSSGCTPAKWNRGICDHNTIAKQLSGKRINLGKPNHSANT